MTTPNRQAELEELTLAQEQQIVTLHQFAAQLQARVQDLEARLAQDSHNSSKPPSGYGLKYTTKSLCAKCGTQPGGQRRRRGEWLRLVVTPDELIERRPAAPNARVRA